MFRIILIVAFLLRITFLKPIEFGCAPFSSYEDGFIPKCVIVIVFLPIFLFTLALNLIVLPARFFTEGISELINLSKERQAKLREEENMAEREREELAREREEKRLAN